MKPIHSLELELILKNATFLVGGRFQEFQIQGDQVGFGIYKDRDIHWLWVDLRPQTLATMIFKNGDQPYHGKKSEVKPLALFLKANVMNQELATIEHLTDYGRVFKLGFGPIDHRAEIQVCVLPLGRNIIVQFGEGRKQKKISLFPPHDLGLAPKLSPPDRIRTHEEIVFEWTEARLKSGVNKKSAISPREKLEKRASKLKEAIEKLESESISERENPSEDLWAKTGDWIKVHRSVDVPKDLIEYVDPKLTFVKNMERCFEKSKEFRRKLEKQSGRADELRTDLRELEALLKKPDSQLAKSPRTSGKKESEHKYRYKEFSEGFLIQAGRNAKENLELLRDAQAWDLWFHLRDYPSSHGLLRRNRGQEVSQKVQTEAARWLIEQSFGNKAAKKRGDSFEIVVCEKRFVRPIPGDKVGRVTFHNAHNFKVVL